MNKRRKVALRRVFACVLVVLLVVTGQFVHGVTCGVSIDNTAQAKSENAKQYKKSGKKATTKKQVDYSKYSNTSIGWGLSMHADHSTPGGNVPQGVSLKKYNAYYVGDTSQKIMYLTFDCGYEGGYTKKVLDTLKKAKVKAIFFVTKPFVCENVKLVKRMKREGHLVGNHTCTHPQLSKCSIRKIRKEVNDCASTMKKLTGYTMDRYIRPPEGVYSLRTLKVLKDMNYTTILWSIAYYDYDPQNQPSVDFVVNKFKTYYHKGAIPLLHIVSKADCEALPEIIRFMHSKKYHLRTFRSFKK